MNERNHEETTSSSIRDGSPEYSETMLVQGQTKSLTGNTLQLAEPLLRAPTTISPAPTTTATVLRIGEIGTVFVCL